MAHSAGAGTHTCGARTHRCPPEQRNKFVVMEELCYAGGQREAGERPARGRRSAGREAGEGPEERPERPARGQREAGREAGERPARGRRGAGKEAGDRPARGRREVGEKPAGKRSLDCMLDLARQRKS